MKSSRSTALMAVQSSRWQTQTLESSGEVASLSIAVNASGQPGIASNEGQLSDIQLHSFNGLTWTTESVDTGYLPSLALDADGHPHIAYYSYDEVPTVQYAWHDGIQWHINTIDYGKPPFAPHISLKLDELGHPHIAYQLQSDLLEVKYARYDGTDWMTRTVDSSGVNPSLALDKNGQPQIAYFAVSSTLRSLIHTELINDVWNRETVDDLQYLESFSTYPFLQVDDQGQPHISYTRFNQVKYAWRDQTAWHIETIVKDGIAKSMSLDSLDQPHIGSLNTAGWNYVWRDWRGNWHAEMIMNNGLFNPTQIGSIEVAGNDAHAGFGVLYMDPSDPSSSRYQLIYAVRRSQPDLSASSLSASASSVDAGGRITYTLELVNASPVSATTFAVSNPIPTYTVYVTNSVAATAGTITVTPGITGVTWTGLISPMTVLTASFAVTADGGLTETTAIVNGTTIEGDPTGQIALHADTFYKPYVYWIPQILELF